MPTWPASLPQNVTVAGFNEQPPSSKIRSQNDDGPANQRPRSTSAVRNFTVTVALADSDQVNILDSFFINDLAQGVLSFVWVHPRTQAPASVRMPGIPSYTPRPNRVGYNASFALEILP